MDVWPGMVQSTNTSIAEKDRNMRKLILVGALTIVAAVLAPIASASANEKFKGTCFVEGEATFAPGLKAGVPRAETTYKFADGKVEAEDRISGGPTVECTGEVAARGEKGPWTGGTANVENGLAELECGTKSVDEAEDKAFERATATITLKNAKNETRTFESKFRFTATAKPGEIEAELGNKAKTVTATGRANFTEPESLMAKTQALECGFPAGAKKLSFETAETDPGAARGITGTIGE
jgi:hypothetical protein